VCNSGPCTALLAAASSEELAKHAPTPTELESSPEVIAAQNQLSHLESNQADAAMAYQSAKSEEMEASHALEVSTDEVHTARRAVEQAQLADDAAKHAKEFHEANKSPASVSIKLQETVRERQTTVQSDQVRLNSAKEHIAELQDQKDKAHANEALKAAQLAAAANTRLEAIDAENQNLARAQMVLDKDRLVVSGIESNLTDIADLRNQTKKELNHAEDL
jgi:hypothetical protein